MLRGLCCGLDFRDGASFDLRTIGLDNIGTDGVLLLDGEFVMRVGMVLSAEIGWGDYFGDLWHLPITVDASMQGGRVLIYGGDFLSDD